MIDNMDTQDENVIVKLFRQVLLANCEQQRERIVEVFKTLDKGFYKKWNKCPINKN